MRPLDYSLPMEATQSLSVYGNALRDDLQSLRTGEARTAVGNSDVPMQFSGEKDNSEMIIYLKAIANG